MIPEPLWRPFAYISIKHHEKKIIDVWIPLAAALLLTVVSSVYKSHFNTWGPSGIVNAFQAVIQTLPGFYIAALAAIIALGKNPILDELIEGSPTPSIKMRIQGFEDPQLKPLTRRHFLCLLFSYLTALSLVLCISTALIIYGATFIKSAITFSPLLMLGSTLITLLYFYLAFHLIAVTFFGLYYLADRMYSHHQ